MILYGVAETTYNSNEDTWESHKGYQLANIITCGLGSGVFFLRSDLMENKDSAQNEYYEIRRSDASERRDEWYRYNKYKNKFWVHEFIKNDNGWKAYLPTISEIKCGIEYMKAHPEYKGFSEWLNDNVNKKPADIRKSLIEKFYIG